MDSPVAPAAPAQTTASDTPTVSATIAASEKGDFSAFQDAKQAARAGKPLADVPVTPEPSDLSAAPAPADKTVSKRQQQINDYERRIAELNQRLARLETPPAAPRSDPQPTAPDYKRYLALPDAPKLLKFESVEEHAAAMALFIADKRHEERAAQDSQQRQRADHLRSLEERDRAFGERITQASADDKTFLASLPAPVLHATPLSGCRPDPARPGSFVDPTTGQPVGFLNFVAETAFLSDNPVAFHRAMKDLAPEDRIALARLPGPEMMRRLSQIDGRASASIASPAASASAESTTPSPVSAFPAPTPTLNRPGATVDPEHAALKRDDFGSFQAARQARRLQSLRESQGR